MWAILWIKRYIQDLLLQHLRATERFDFIPQFKKKNNRLNHLNFIYFPQSAFKLWVSKKTRINMANETISRRSLYVCAVLLLVVVLANFVQSQLAEKLIQNPCVSKQTCHDCIQAKSCAWCLQPDIGDKPRCFQPSLSPLSGGCPEEYTYNPDNVETLLVKKALSRGGSSVASRGSGQSAAAGDYWSRNQEESYSKNEYTQESWDTQRQQTIDQSSRKSGKKVNYGSYTESGNIVQIYPQRVQLKLRISMYHRIYIDSVELKVNHKFMHSF